jgi:hypothetical protein
MKTKTMEDLRRVVDSAGGNNDNVFVVHREDIHRLVIVIESLRDRIRPLQPPHRCSPEEPRW